MPEAVCHKKKLGFFLNFQVQRGGGLIHVCLALFVCFMFDPILSDTNILIDFQDVS
jgi:hypothetical protein